ncbi:MAG: HEAT repeat domain-containing protein [Chloroflexota bacterium]
MPTLQSLVEAVLSEETSTQERKNATEHLRSGAYGDPVLALLAYLADPDPYCSTYALHALMRIDHERAFPAVLPFLADPDRQYSICRWIASLGADESAIEPVIQVLESGNHPGDRVMALGALERIGDERAIAALQRAMEYDHEED